MGNVRKLRTGFKRTPKSLRFPRSQIDPDLLCGVIFVDKGFTAKILFYLLNASLCNFRNFFGRYRRRRFSSVTSIFLVLIELILISQDVCKHDKDLQFLSPLYTIEKNPEVTSSTHDKEVQHRKQEEVLKSFRIHECNLLIATSILEEGTSRFFSAVIDSTINYNQLHSIRLFFLQE